jgi:uncharacterized membrane protein HdeD (DUF308 family)
MDPLHAGPQNLNRLNTKRQPVSNIGLGALAIAFSILVMAFPLFSILFLIYLGGFALLFNGIAGIIQGIGGHLWSRAFVIGVGILSIIISALVIPHPISLGVRLLVVIMSMVLLINGIEMITIGIIGRRTEGLQSWLLFRLD